MNFKSGFDMSSFEMLDGMMQIPKLYDLSYRAIDYAKEAQWTVAKVWLANAVTEICEAHEVDVNDFCGYVTGDFKHVRNSVLKGMEEKEKAERVEKKLEEIGDILGWGSF